MTSKAMIILVKVHGKTGWREGEKQSIKGHEEIEK